MLCLAILLFRREQVNLRSPTFHLSHVVISMLMGLPHPPTSSNAVDVILHPEAGLPCDEIYELQRRSNRRKWSLRGIDSKEADRNQQTEVSITRLAQSKICRVINTNI